eukprot:TRINITY_DN19497_c0_g1_i1.p1 TRINITY_DN19497_c0_g1~~TRINITY_DN19497_c0_g1_i1.p1  ORF type:complete len:512 (+),score=124.88 TRINITY_DN19497_c0_g1_i1:116-1651(+)
MTKSKGQGRKARKGGGVCGNMTKSKGQGRKARKGGGSGPRTPGLQQETPTPSAIDMPKVPGRQPVSPRPQKQSQVSPPQQESKDSPQALEVLLKLLGDHRTAKPEQDAQRKGSVGDDGNKQEDQKPHQAPPPLPSQLPAEEDIRGRVWQMACTKDGSLRLQDLLKQCSKEAAEDWKAIVDIVITELQGRVLQVSTEACGYANYVIQVCISELPPEKFDFVIQELKGHVVLAAKHRAGCRVLQRIVEHVGDKDDWTLPLLEEILEGRNLVELSLNEFGNYVIQKFFEHASEKQRNMLAEALLKLASSDPAALQGMVMDKRASHVIEHALVNSCEEKRQELMDILGALMQIPVPKSDGSQGKKVKHKEYSSFVSRCLKRLLELGQSPQKAETSRKDDGSFGAQDKASSSTSCPPSSTDCTSRENSFAGNPYPQYVSTAALGTPPQASPKPLYIPPGFQYVLSSSPTYVTPLTSMSPTLLMRMQTVPGMMAVQVMTSQGQGCQQQSPSPFFPLP